MSPRRTTNGIADWIRAARAVPARRVDIDLVAAVGRLLGFVAEVEIRTRTPPLPEHDSEDPGPERLPDPREEVPRPVSEQRATLRPKLTPNDAWIETLTPSTGTPAIPVAAPRFTTNPGAGEDLAEEIPEPLFRARHSRSIITALVRRSVRSHVLDIVTLIRIVTKGQVVTRIPFAPRFSTERGVQVLLDSGPSMRPFLLDARTLIDQVERAIGRSRIETYYFQEEPGKAARGRLSRRVAHSWSKRGRGVLVVTDFGLGLNGFLDPLRIEPVWRRFLGEARSNGSQVIALAPRKAAEYPDWLRRMLSVVTWDRSTSAASIVAERRARSEQ